MADTIEQAIEENALGPKRATGDEGSVEQHSLLDQIAADKHLATRAAVRLRRRGIRFIRLIPPGAC